MASLAGLADWIRASTTDVGLDEIVICIDTIDTVDYERTMTGMRAFAGVVIDKALVEARLANGRLELAPLQLAFYGGTLDGVAGAMAADNSVNARVKLAGVNLNPLLRDLASTDLLAGRAPRRCGHPLAHELCDHDAVTRGRSVSRLNPKWCPGLRPAA